MFGWLCSAFCALPRFRGKQRILLQLFRWPGFRSARSFYGVRMAENVADSTWRACMVGSYGDFISGYLAGLEQDFVFLDIGANQGVFSLCAVKNPHCRRVIAFEPNPFTFAKLAANAELSGRSGDFRLFAAALCEPGLRTISMSVPLGHSGASSMAATDARDSYSFVAQASDAAIIADACADMAELPVHAKIDVEGAEPVVLRELERSGSLGRIASIVIEVSDKVRGGSEEEILQFFSDRNWRMAARSGHANHFDAVFVPPAAVQEHAGR